MSVVYGTGGLATLELETLTGPPPAVRVTVSGVASTTTFTLTRLCEGVTQTVPGWRANTFTDSLVYTDWVAPLDRPVTYSLSAGGVVVASATITLPSGGTGWLQDPLLPEQSVAVALNRAGGDLSLDGSALKQIDYKNQSSPIPILGSPTPVFFGGQRRAGSGLNLTMRSFTDTASAAFVNLITDTPILLLRTIPAMTGVPALAYLNADVSQKPFTKHLPGGQQQVWTITGDLISAVMQAAITGAVTYDEVQQLLAGYTYVDVLGKAGQTTYLDWQKNPLIFSTL